MNADEQKARFYSHVNEGLWIVAWPHRKTPDNTIPIILYGFGVESVPGVDWVSESVLTQYYRERSITEAEQESMTMGAVVAWCKDMGVL